MSWFSKLVPSKIRTVGGTKRTVPEGLWIKCDGCSACIVACYVENNVPVIGEEGVLRSRQMSWLRIERFVGSL